MRSFSCALLILSLICSGIQASHYHYGTINWQQIGTNTVQFTIQLGYRHSYYNYPAVGAIVDNQHPPAGNPNRFNFGDGTVVFFNSTVIQVDTDHDACQVETTLNHTYATPNRNGLPWTAWFANQARLSALLNSHDQPWNLTTTVNLLEAGASPTVSQTPIVQISVDPVNVVTSFSIGASPASTNASISYTLARSGQMCGNGNCTQPPQFKVDSKTGVITWNTTGVTHGLWCSYVIAKQGNISVPVDFMLNLTKREGYCSACSGYPSCTETSGCRSVTTCGITSTSVCQLQAIPVFVAPTPNTTVQAVVGDTVTFSVRASSADGAAANITLKSSDAPSGASLSDAGSGSNPDTVNFSWTTGAGDVGSRVVTFTAESKMNNPGGATTTASHFVSISVAPPPCQPMTCDQQHIYCGNFTDGCGTGITCGNSSCNSIVILNGKNALTVGGSATSGSKVIITAFNSNSGPTLQQEWIFNLTQNADYIVYAGDMNLILCKSSSTSELVVMDKTTLSSAAAGACRWAMPKTDNATQFVLANVGANKVWDIYTASPANGAPIITYPQKPYNVQNQLFYAYPVPAANAVAPGAMYIKSYPKGYYVTANASEPLAEGIAVVNSPMLPANNSMASRQQWIVKSGGVVKLASSQDYVIALTSFYQKLKSATNLGATSTANYYWTWAPCTEWWATQYSYVFNTPGSPVATAPASTGSAATISAQADPAIASQMWTIMKV